MYRDGALVLLNAVDPSGLKTESDKAFYALLMTQARYRNYIVASSDSLINVALNYYHSHADKQERLINSLIYKGAVMEELGQADEAMRYFKRALELIPADDYYNQGYVRLRIGNIYRN